MHRLSLLAPHESLRVRVHAEVETSLANPFDYVPVAPADERAWLERQLQDDPGLHDFVLHRSDAVPELPGALGRLRGAGLRRRARRCSRTSQAAMAWATATFRYESGTTEVHAPLAEFAERRAGVCQDFAHLFVALVRSWGFAARYVMGYVDAGAVLEAEPEVQATHAWTEVLIPGAGWRGFDATSGLVANDAYIPVAVGRDSRDAAPVRGTFKGDDGGARAAASRCACSARKRRSNRSSEDPPGDLLRARAARTANAWCSSARSSRAGRARASRSCRASTATSSKASTSAIASPRGSKQLGKERPDALLGQVELYPALNPLGLDTLRALGADLRRRSQPQLSRSRRRPAAAARRRRGDARARGRVAGGRHPRLATSTCARSRRCASRRTSRTTLVPIARDMNLDLIWVHGAATVLENTIAHSLNASGVPCLVVEMGVGMRVTPVFAEQVVIGILHAWQALGVLADDLELEPNTHAPLIAHDGNVHYLNAEVSGLFVPSAAHWMAVGQGQLLGRIVSPLRGEVLAEVRSPVEGVLFTLREYPLVYEGSLLARIMETQR